MLDAFHHEEWWYLSAPTRSTCPNHRTVQLRSDILPTRKTDSLLQPHSHDVEELSQRFTEWILQLPDRSDERTKRRLNFTFGRLQSIETTMNGRAWIDLTVLKDHMLSFDELFFQGALRPFVKLSIEENIFQDSTGTFVGRSYVIQGPTWTDLEQGQPFIGIRIWNWSNPSCEGETDPGKRRSFILQTLLHEMVHALITIYRCRGNACNTTQRIQETRGPEGHGPSWRAIMRAIQRTVSAFEHLEKLVDSAALGDDVARYEEL